MRFPGKAIFGTPTPPDLAPPPPVPTREDAGVAEARRRQQLADAQRKGRRATILFGGEEDEALGQAPIRRPEARGAQLLGD